MVSFLTIVVVLVMAIAVVVRLMKVVELAGELRGKTEEEVTESDNQLNGYLFIGFMIFLFVLVIYQVVHYKDYMMTPPASEQGVAIDNLMYFTFIIIGIVFFITQALLFYFAYKYHSKKETKADYYPHNNKLELIWTIVPSIVLTAMIIYGLSVWKNVMMDDTGDKPVVIELFSKQFKFMARYPGNDGQLGMHNYKFIQGVNELGLDTNDTKSFDDQIVSGEFHIPVGKTIEFHLRSQDVLHGAYMPYFRIQMNTVPGMTTTMKFKPTITTKEMKVIMKDENFKYLLLCNKICGSSHYNMQMDIVVDTEEEYNTWLKEQKAFKAPAEAPKTAAIVADSTKATAVNEPVEAHQ